jgi:hypothetical protein
MTGKIAILYPSIVMALLTVCLIFAMGARRFMAVQQRKVSLKYYRTYSEGEGEPPSLRQHSRHVQNHFEVPPLFHLAVWGTYLAGEVSSFAVAAAWLFVASRCVHSTIHLGYNNVNHRFFAFGIGLTIVLILWIRLLLTLGG